MLKEMPAWEVFMIPTLQVMSDGVVRHRRELQPLVADLMRLPQEQRDEMISSGQKKFENRIGWGLSFLTNVGALERPRRANYVITDAGRELIPKFPEGATEREIRKLGHDPTSLIRPYKKSERASATTVEEPNTPESLTPIEQIESGIERIREEVSIELLSKLQGREPGFFEEAVVELLLAMGYGGTSGVGAVTKMSNDGGIDGVIDQDILGLNRVYIQAKRYSENNIVGRPDLQGFVGALSGKADSGVFITTSRFSDAAVTYAKNVPTRIILIDGSRLTDLMIRYGVGVQVRETYKIVEIDEDFFA
ncbi:restriction endonuclease [Corynebacterium ammoniagenes]|uniref:Restriction endonuclease n=1 Tax=Corynebacterium ammoniagenes TaxID=1697 RepID=A0AAV5G2P9_CORAM|nr:restriction endonuclease [Corynebacterium ammoniagenes]GJN42929.1 restriction endonuclease [Corynebacterium ammoniagenes]